MTRIDSRTISDTIMAIDGCVDNGGQIWLEIQTHGAGDARCEIPVDGPTAMRVVADCQEQDALTVSFMRMGLEHDIVLMVLGSQHDQAAAGPFIQMTGRARRIKTETLRPVKPGTMGAPAEAFTAYVRGIHIVYSVRRSWAPGLGWCISTVDGQWEHAGFGTLRQAIETADWMAGNMRTNKSDFVRRQQALLDILDDELYGDRDLESLDDSRGQDALTLRNGCVVKPEVYKEATGWWVVLFPDGGSFGSFRTKHQAIWIAYRCWPHDQQHDDEAVTE